MKKLLLLFICCLERAVDGLFVDDGDPYHDGPLHTSEMVLTKTMDNSPLHTLVYYPAQRGTYPAVIFASGLYTFVPSENYQNLMSKVASHGFFVFGIDVIYPGFQDDIENNNVQDMEDAILHQIQWMQNYMRNKTLASVEWTKMGLLCHSAGCDTTLLLAKKNHSAFSFPCQPEDKFPYAGHDVWDTTLPGRSCTLFHSWTRLESILPNMVMSENQNGNGELWTL